MKIRLYGVRPKDKHLHPFLRDLIYKHLAENRCEFETITAKAIYSNTGRIKWIDCSKRVFCKIILQNYTDTESEAYQ